MNTYPNYNVQSSTPLDNITKSNSFHASRTSTKSNKRSIESSNKYSSSVTQDAKLQQSLPY